MITSNVSFKRFVLTLIIFIGSVIQVNAQCLVTTGPTNDCSYGDAIDNIVIGGTTVSNSGCSSGSGYSSFSSPVWNFTLGSSYPLSLAVGGGQYSQGVAIWIDMNGNGMFESTEYLWNSATSGVNLSGTLTIPSTGITGTTVMRIMCSYNAVPTSGQACTSNIGNYGETEDYVVNLLGNDNVEATAVVSPLTQMCGTANDSLVVRVSNVGSVDATDVPIRVNLSGMFTNSYFDTIPSITAGNYVDTYITTLNTATGGVLGVQLITDYALDSDGSNDTLNTNLTFWDTTDLVITGPTTACVGQMLTFSSNAGTDSAVWYGNGALLDTAVMIMTDTLTSTVQIVLTSVNTCRSNDTLDLAVTDLVTGSFTSSVTGGQADFTGAATDYVTITWDYGDGAGTGTGLTSSYTYGQNGSYNVCMTINGDCDTLVYCDTVVISSLGLNVFDLGDVSVFPNPTTGLVTISLNNLLGLEGNWTLLDLSGKVLESKELNVKNENETIQLSLESQPAGTYIFKLTTKEGQHYQLNLIRN